MASKESLVWLVPEDRGGIRTYSNVLWPFMVESCARQSIQTVSPISDLLSNEAEIEKSVEVLVKLQPTLIHVQHEFGLFGSKVPGFYLFPKWLERVRSALPSVRIFATAHTVLDPSYRYPLKKRGWQTPLRWLANQLILPVFRRKWVEETWAGLDGVFVHSKQQQKVILAAGCSSVRVVPHFVPRAKKIWAGKNHPGQKKFQLIVFGFITPEKGQDIVIEALARLDSSVHLILAGGIRRNEDQNYLKMCEQRIRKLGLTEQVTVTGFVPEEVIDRYYASSDLVLAPFRETNGSGSLAQAFARGAPVLASDLPLNREMNEIEPGCLAFFKTENPEDCAAQIKKLLAALSLRQSLSDAALRYAEKRSPDKIVQEYVNGYGC